MTLHLGWVRPWAVARPQCEPQLRQGAWYPVVAVDPPHNVVVEVRHKRTVVPRKMVEMREKRPARFTVVYRSHEDRNPALNTASDRGRVYAVCPKSGHRVRIGPSSATAVCSACGHEGEVAWWETG